MPKPKPQRQLMQKLQNRVAIVEQINIWLKDHSDNTLTQRMASTVFMIRLAGAVIIYLSQIILARWMGAVEFGIYIYVWTWVILLGDIIHMGLGFAAQRIIPDYTKQKAFDALRGFLRGSRWFVFIVATIFAGLCVMGVYLLAPWLADYEILPLYLGCATLPFYALANMQDGIARCYNWATLALMPQYMLRPLFLLIIMATLYMSGNNVDAVTAIISAIVATWAATMLQMVWLNKKLKKEVPTGNHQFLVEEWLTTSLPILVVWGFYTLLTYIDIVILRQFRPPEEVAIYYAASKTSTLVAFVYFSIAAAVAHKYSEYYLSGDSEAFSNLVHRSVHWTFWPSLALTIVVLVLGQFILSLFGSEFTAGYGLMFIFAIGLLARASIGPAERLLNMVGERRRCAFIYFTAFMSNAILCLILIPHYGIYGAAISLSVAMVVESAMLFYVAKTRLGIHIWVFNYS